jgi:hypothetical protein
MKTKGIKSILSSFNAQLDEQCTRTAERMAVTGISLVVERIQSRGVEGAEYSDNRLPAWYIKGKELNSGGIAYFDKHNKAGDGVTWGENRAAQGLQNSYVDLTYSGRMLGSWVVLKVEKGRGRFVSRTGSTDSEGDAKLAYQVLRYGPETFEPTLAEQAEVDEIAKDDLEAFLKRFFS